MFFLSAENVKNCLKSAVDVLSNHCRLHFYYWLNDVNTAWLNFIPNWCLLVKRKLYISVLFCFSVDNFKCLGFTSVSNFYLKQVLANWIDLTESAIQRCSVRKCSGNPCKNLGTISVNILVLKHQIFNFQHKRLTH